MKHRSQPKLPSVATSSPTPVAPAEAPRSSGAAALPEIARLAGRTCLAIARIRALRGDGPTHRYPSRRSGDADRAQPLAGAPQDARSRQSATRKLTLRMLQRPFTRLAIVNRGEPAMRLIHAVRELNEQRREPIVLIALYTESSGTRCSCARPTRPSASARARAARTRSGYLDHAALERALVAARADAAWVGWGFVAEDPAFADLCERLGIVFVGPRSGDDAARRRQDRGEAARRGGGRPRRAVERRPGRDRRGGARARRAHRLPADDQGRRGRRRPRHPPRRRARTSWPRRSDRAAPRRSRRSATARSCSSGSSPRPGTSRCR